MSDQPNRPILVVLTSHWLTMLGVALVTLAGFSWIFVLPANLRGRVDNPYIGLLVFIAIPVIFFAGLALIPIGIALGNRRIAATLPDLRTAWRRAGIFFAVMTAANLIIASQASYRAVEYMDTVQFCGQSCHVMKPEFTAHGLPPHQQVECASCHVGPGATGWINAKMAGTRQLMAVIFNNFPRPIESAIESNRLVSSAETCERCHARQKPIGPRLRILAKYNDDETNTRTETVLLMMVDAIHQAHLGPGVHIRYAPQDKKRQTIPWVEYRDATASRTYLAAGFKADSLQSLPTFEMQCVDCHNRPAHTFEDPDRAVDRSIAAGAISTALPFVKKTGVELIKAVYSSDEDAAEKIPAALADFYRQKYSDVAGQHANEIQAAGRALAAIYQRNVFPDLKVTWGTYPNNLGHVDAPGCFRCHDDSHAASSGRTIAQNCDSCHKALAVEETSPEILKTLSLDNP